MQLLKFFLPLFFLPLAAKAQDIITLHDSTRIEAKVINITPEIVSYKEFNYPDGPTIVLDRSQVYKIKYPNGQERVIYAATSKSSPEAGYVPEKQAVAPSQNTHYQARTVAERTAMFETGKQEARDFYSGSSTKLGVGIATFFGGGIGGIVIGGIAYLTPPDVGMHPVSNPQLRKDPDFRKGYEQEAHKKKHRKVASGFGIGLGALVALVTIINL